jgi:HD-GYP domain-containing protein (c-di-GMP phosphodiesterase class II)
MSPVARMMAIADIFEALTAAYRPYKKAKLLSESLQIKASMRNENHIDPDLFELFLNSGVYKQYAHLFLAPDQIDEVAIEDYLHA